MGVVDTGEKKEKVIDGEFTEVGKAGAGEPNSAIARIEPASPQALAAWKPRLLKEVVDEQIEQVAERKRFYKEVMKEGIDYAIIPGQKPTPRINQDTGEPIMEGGRPVTDPPKPALLKPGAEKLVAAMGLHPEMSHEVGYPKEELRGEEWYFEFERVCSIYVQTGPGEHDRMLVARFSGSCNSWEEKYRYRGSGRTCPECGNVGSIIKGNPQYAPRRSRDDGGGVEPAFAKGGYVCWKKKGGCDAKFPDDYPAIVNQDEKKVANPNPHDLKNTILKMADKRALVAATLIATGCSDLFTQDIEEGAEAPAGAAKPVPADSPLRAAVGTHGVAPAPMPPVQPKPAAPVVPPMTPDDVELIKTTYKGMKQLAKTTKVAADICAAFASFMVQEVNGNWNVLWSDAKFTARAKEILQIKEEPPTPAQEREAEAAMQDPAKTGSFNPEEVPA